MIRQQLMHSEDIRRVRKKAPCTHAEISAIQKQLLEDEIFRAPILTGGFNMQVHIFAIRLSSSLLNNAIGFVLDIIKMTYCWFSIHRKRIYELATLQVSWIFVSLISFNISLLGCMLWNCSIDVFGKYV